jgi:hypothetical protein
MVHGEDPRFGGTGPVEELRDDEGAAAAEQLASPAGPGAAERWRALPPARRRAALAVTGLVVAGAVTGTVLARLPEDPPPPPVPVPTLVTDIGYRGIHLSSDDGTFLVLMAMTVAPDARVPVELTRVTQGYPSLSSHSESALPLKVVPGQSLSFALRVRVRDCSKTPISASMPLINVTLRNTRAIRTRSEIFGERYARQLSRVLRSLCPTVAKASTQLSSR